MSITKKYCFYYDYTGVNGYRDEVFELEVYDVDQNILLKNFFLTEDIDDNDLYQKQQEAENNIYESYYDQHRCYNLYDFNIRFSHFIIETCFDYYIEFIDRNGKLICIDNSIYFNIYEGQVEQYGDKKLSDLKEIILNDNQLKEYLLSSNHYYSKEILKFEIK